MISLASGMLPGKKLLSLLAMAKPPVPGRRSAPRSPPCQSNSWSAVWVWNAKGCAPCCWGWVMSMNYVGPCNSGPSGVPRQGPAKRPPHPARSVAMTFLVRPMPCLLASKVFAVRLSPRPRPEITPAMKHRGLLRTGLSPPSMATSEGDPEWRVVDDLPPEIPVTQPEIDLLARFCRDILDAYLRPAPTASSTARGAVSPGLDRTAGRK